jgi:hypothetical protein
MSPRKPPGRKKAAAGRKKTTQGARQGTPSSSRKRTTTRSRLRLLPRRTPPARPTTPPPSAFPQAQDGSLKQKLLFELVRARVAVHAAIQGVAPGSAEETVGPGRWSVREHVLHLHATDRAVLRSVEAALLGRTPEWMSLPTAAREAWGQESLAPLLHFDWSEALRRLHAGRDQLMETLESVAEDPASTWEPGHPFAALLALVIAGDREHAEAIKRWRTTRESG